MRTRLIIGVFILILLSIMNTYSRALRHISMKDVKQKHRQKLVERKLQEDKKKEEKRYIASVMEEEKYNWREKLNEQMTSSGTFFTTLPATGDLEYTISGETLDIVSGGYNVTFNSSNVDTFVFDIILDGGETATVSSGINSLNITSSGTYELGVSQSKTLTVKFRFSGTGTASVPDIRSKRKTPINVFVPLDSPEASSFVRTDTAFAGLSEAEKKQKLKEMLDASDEYVMKILGSDFPGTGSVPPGEYDPFAQVPPGEAGDTPGVEIAGGYGLRPDGTSGMNKVGDKVYDPNTKKEYKLVPSSKYGGGNEWIPVRQADTSNQDTQIAQAKPIEPAQQRRGTTGVGVPDTTGTSPGSNLPPSSQMNYPKEWLPKQARSRKIPMVASYEPEGKLISEKKKKYNWRGELQKDKKKYFVEGMTTSDIFYANLPATGDVTLGTLPNISLTDADLEGSYEDYPPDVDFAIAPRTKSLPIIDTSTFDTMVITVSGAGNTRTVDGSLLSDSIRIGVLVGGTYVGNYISGDLGNGTHIVTIPERFRTSNTKFDVIQITAIQGVSGTVSVSNIRFQRRTPMSVFVPLDSPEATAFIRTDPMMSNLSPEERKQKLKEMLEASDEYVMKMLGLDFPGTGAVPPGEAGDTPGVDTIDYGTDLTPLSDNPYGTEVSQDAGIYQSPDGSYYSRPDYPKPDTSKWPSIKDPVPPIPWPTPGVYRGGQGKV